MDTVVVCRHKHGELVHDARLGTDVFYPSRVVCIDCLRLHLMTKPGASPLPKDIVECVMEIAERLSRA
jgi:hypothetical protein